MISTFGDKGVNMNIVVAVDDSDESRIAAEKAAEAAKRNNANLTLLHSVKREVVSGDNGIIQEGHSSADERGQFLLENIQRELNEQYNLSVEHEILSGQTPVENILSYVEKHNPDALYIGHRNLSEREESMIGSFAKKIIGDSPVPVTVVSGPVVSQD